MALKIEEQTADALTFRIAEGLNTVSGVYIGLYGGDFKWAGSVAESLPESLNDRLNKICGDNGLSEFIRGQVVYTLEEDDSWDRDSADHLKDIPGFSEAIEASKSLINDLKLLPYSYRMVAPLPKSLYPEFKEICESIEIGPGISIMSGDKIKDSYPISTDIDERDERIFRGLDSGSIKIAPDTLYLVQQRSGYIGQQSEPPILADFKSTLRQLLGALLAVKALNPVRWAREPVDAAYVAHRLRDEAELTSAEEFSIPLREFYALMSAPEHGNGKKKIDIEDNKRKVEAIKSVFMLNDHGRRLSVAAIWYLRSCMSSDTLDALLESTIALEALLGGANAEGNKLSSLLGNRCAYLIGRSLNDRQEILSKFSEIYTLRSKIVHEGHHRFTKREQDLLIYSKELCRRALVKEMLFAPDKTEQRR